MSAYWSIDPRGFDLQLGMDEPEMEIIRFPYCTITDVERILHRYDLDLSGEGHNDPEAYERWVGETIRAAERWMDFEMQTTFHRVKRREWKSGEFNSELQMDYAPIIKVDRVVVFSATLEQGTEFNPRTMVVDRETGTVGFPALYFAVAPIAHSQQSGNVVGYTFWPGNHNVMIEYWYGAGRGISDHGFGAGIRDGAAKLAAAMLLEEADERKSQGLISLNLEGQGSQYGRWSQRAEKLRIESQAVTARYRRLTFGGTPR
jgi:hypothetical protein